MTVKPNEADILRENIRAALDEQGLEPIPLAVELDRGRDFLTDFLKGRKKKLEADFLGELAVRLGYPSANHLKHGDKGIGRRASVDALVDEGRVRRGSSQAPPPLLTRPAQPVLREIGRQIPVVGEVAAGVWKTAVARESFEIEEHITLDVAGYERADLRAMKVVGPSVNLVYAPGRYVIVAHPSEAGSHVGDMVVVQRMQGDLAEITIKELAEIDGRIALIPRSSDPAYQDPIFLKDDHQDQSAPEIIGVVVADYGRRERPATLLTVGRTS